MVISGAGVVAASSLNNGHGSGIGFLIGFVLAIILAILIYCYEHNWFNIFEEKYV